MENIIHVSCSGKILIIGGYLILEKENFGLVLTTNSRFHTFISSTENPNLISIFSQNYDQNYSYEFSTNPIFLKSTNPKIFPSNKFLETTLLFTLSFIYSSKNLSPLEKKGLKMTIFGDSAFYSKKSNDSMGKTGLGSSAALVVSLTGSLLHFFQIVDLANPKSEDLFLIHNLSQFCHCVAQGKIGSGFDISAAVYGSQKFQRFSQTVLKEYIEKPFEIEPHFLESFSKLINSKEKWDNFIQPFKLPSNTKLILIDTLSGGSETVPMVRRYLKWKNEKPQESSKIISHLKKNNSKMENLLNQKEILEEQIDQIRKIGTKIRFLMKKMGELSDVPIEPEEQSQRINQIFSIKEVIFAGIPGAGGLDAIFVIYIDKEDIFKEIEEKIRILKMRIIDLKIINKPIQLEK
ncbi:phosphomevalonate kinase [Anaeramoeba ignava]|uniref:phosphomevalonate kinase n=1 Tax=Anaeramoeba ignava TaxID=1746090 RepID=A0A9Q0RAB9_ANAIG|nr:phosphomevalonate kinase [Anaeramoeba ignava]